MQLWPLHGGFLHAVSSTRQLGASVLTAVRHGVVSRAAVDFAVPVNMPDPIRIRSGSGGTHWPEVGRMILAHRLTSGPDLQN